MRNSIRLRLTFIFIGLATIPLLIVSLLLAQRNFALLTEQAIDLQSEIAQRVSNDVENFIKNRENELSFLVTTRNVIGIEQDQQNESLIALLAKQEIYEQIALLNSDGQETTRIEGLKFFSDEALTNRATLPEFEEPKATGQIYYSPVQFNNITGEPYMIIAIPSYEIDTGEFNGVLTANFRLRSIWDLMSSAQLPDKSIIYLVDAQNRIVAHRDPSVILSGTKIELPQNNGFFPGLESTMAAMAIESNTFGTETLHTVAEMERNEALALAISNFLVTLAALLIAFIIAISSSIVAAQQIVSPIESMAATTEAIAAGDLSQEIYVTQRDEIGTLATAFNRMTAQLRDLIGGLEQEIQERIEAEKSLQRFHAILESTSDFVGLADKNGQIFYINRAGLDLVGIDPAIDVTTLHIQNFHPSKIFDTIISEGLSTAKAQGIWSGESAFQTQNGRKIAALQVIIAHKSDEGDVEYYSTIARDITERKLVEEQIQQYTVELERSNKELEQFAYVSSHDLQEPLRKILIFSNRLQEKYSDTLDIRGLDYLQRMQNAAERMQNLIEDLLSFSRVSATPIRPYHRVNLNNVMVEIISDLEPRLQELDGKIIVAKLPTIAADITQMRQLFLNLLSNSLKFHRDGIPPQVRVECEILPATETAVSQCQISIIDNGLGFNEKYSERIFVMFQRLHSQSQREGTGVGLAICQKIVEKHNGIITAHSPDDTGATFVVTLPITQ